MKELTKEEILRRICKYPKGEVLEPIDTITVSESMAAMDQYSDQTHQVDMEFAEFCVINGYLHKKGYGYIDSKETFATIRDLFDYWQEYIKGK